MNPTHAIEQLRAARLTEKAIALRVGVTQPTINRIRHGVMQPSWETGEALIRLAKKVTRSKRHG